MPQAPVGALTVPSQAGACQADQALPEPAPESIDSEPPSSRPGRQPGARSADTARVARVHVLAPTEWNFHAEGAFARWLATGHATTAQVRLAAATLDPCLSFSIDEVAAHA